MCEECDKYDLDYNMDTLFSWNKEQDKKIEAIEKQINILKAEITKSSLD